MDTSDFVRAVNVAHSQSELDRRQGRIDARQDQVDQAQTGGDQRQAVLDSQQDALAQPRPTEPSTAAQMQAESHARNRAALQRAENGASPAQEP